MKNTFQSLKLSFLIIALFVLFPIVRDIRATEIVSIGGGCVVARATRQNNLRNIAYPFDWLITPMQSLKAALLDDFAQVLVPEQTHERDDNLAVIDGYGFVFVHDFPTICNPIAPIDGEIMPVHQLIPNWRDSITVVREKFYRRLQRLLKLLREGNPVALVRYKDAKYCAYPDEMDRAGAEQFVSLLKQKFPHAKVVLVVVGSTPEFKQPWNIPHICNFYIEEKDSRAWDGQAWADIVHKIAQLQPQGWATDNNHDSGDGDYVLTLPLYNPGFFSVFNTVLGALDYYDRGYISGLRIDFEDKGWYFDTLHGKNWWNYYFEPIALGNHITAEKLFPTYQKIIFAYESQFEMAHERAHELIQKYIHVLPHIKQQVDDFCKQWFSDCFVIGVHYRGTDKVFESSPVDYDTVAQNLRTILIKHAQEKVKIFVATDDSKFAPYVKEQFGDLIVMRDALRSETTTGVHTRLDFDPYQKGEDALIDCLLLSKCSLLIKMASNLSDCSLQFNPNIPVIRLNTSYSE